MITDLHRRMKMEGQNILYGNVEDLRHVRGIVEARGKVRDEIIFLNSEKVRLEKDVKAEEKQLADNIDNTLRKRREQVVANFDKELQKSQERLKKVRNARGKEKDKKVAERIKDETADLVTENKNIHEEIRTFFKQKGIPTMCDSNVVYTLYFPNSPKQMAILALVFIIGIIALPSLVTSLFIGGWFIRAIVFILLQAAFLGLYVLGYNYTRVRNKEAFIDMRVKRNAIRKNESKINRIKKSIKKDKDEDQYGLHEYDEDIEEIEDAIEDIVRKKNEVLSDFEKTTKNDICEEITKRDMPKIDDIKKKISETSIKLKELEQKQKDMSINLSTNYGPYLGEENMTVDRINMLIGLIENHEASNIGDAVNILKNSSKK